MSGASDGTAGWSCALAPAKLNLELRVLGRRDDGYHEIDSEVVCVGPCDVVRLRPLVGAPSRAVVSGPAASDDVPRDARNLAVRAVDAVLARAAQLDRAAVLPSGFELHLFKTVPSRAGLGGSSSDAAAAVLAARDALAASGGPLLGARACVELLAELGSDTVLFAAARFGGHARLRGRGERVDPLPGLRGRWYALVVPDVGCSTAAVYAAHGSAAPGKRDGFARGGPNDLAAAARAVEPVLDAWFEALGPRFHLSGSGSALFAQAADERDARTLVEHARAAAAALGRVPRLVTHTRATGHGARTLAIAGPRRARPRARSTTPTAEVRR